MKTKSSKSNPVHSGAGKEPDDVQGDSPGGMASGNGKQMEGGTGGGSRLVMPTPTRTLEEEAAAWATPSLTTSIAALNPDWTEAEVQRHVMEEIESNPFTHGFILFTPKQRTEMLSAGMTPFQIDTYALHRVFNVHDGEAGDILGLKTFSSPN